MASLKGAGTNDKKKVAIAAVLGLVVLGLAIHTIFGGPSPAPAPAAAPVQSFQAATAPPPPSYTHAGATQTAAAAPGGASSLDPTLHPEWMAENEDYLYKGTGRNIFSRSSAPPPVHIEKVKAPIRPSMQQTQPTTMAAGPPSIQLRFFGYSLRENGARHAFLLHNDDVFIASVGDVVGHRYKIVRIARTSIEIEDLPFHDTQTLPLVQN